MTSAPFLVNLIAFIFIGWYNSPPMVGALGISNSIYAFFNNMFVIINSDCQGVWVTEKFAEGKYKQARLINFRSYGITTLINIFSLCFYIRIDLILGAIGFDAETSY